MEGKKVPARKDGRVIIHFDYDCFYASVFEAKNPALKSLPFAVQQKQIIVTVNYEGRRRGLHKLQLIKDAKRICPEVIIELGEDIGKFRDASKELYGFLRGFSWSGRVERLGFDEVWLDVTDIVDYNVEVLNMHDLQHSFFQTSKDDPTMGFEFDATTIAGHTFPKDQTKSSDDGISMDDTKLRLRLGSHLAMHMRHQLEQQKGYTSTVGIATNKLLSKLVGNVNKPKDQTTLLPESGIDGLDSHVTSFMDALEIGKVPGIGFKSAQKLREFVLQRPVGYDYMGGGTKEIVTVAQVRQHPDVDHEKLEKLLCGPGSVHGIGYKVWCLLHGIDDSEVGQARQVPRQISIEDSYVRLDTMPQLIKEMTALAKSLINRMRIDLLTHDDDAVEETTDDKTPETNTRSHPSSLAGLKWLAHPKTLRLTTRPRSPLQPDGTRARTFKRISHSCPLPTFVFLLNESAGMLAEKLVQEHLLAMFRRLHPQKTGWNLSLVNLAVTQMVETAGEGRGASGRDIGGMFRRQEDVLREFRVREDDDDDVQLSEDPRETTGHAVADAGERMENESGPHDAEDEGEEGWLVDEDGVDDATDFCHVCGSAVPSFAMIAHQRFHSPGVA